MARKIERSRIEAGRFELPTKLTFLSAEKLEFLSVTDKDGQWSVEMPVAAVQKLVKARADLKLNKSEQKKLLADHSAGLDAERTAHQATRDELSRLQRRVKGLEKKLGIASGPSTKAGRPVAVKAGD